MDLTRTPKQRIRASKENLVQVLEHLRPLAAESDDLAPVVEFLEACQGRLPRDASYERDASNKKARRAAKRGDL